MHKSHCVEPTFYTGEIHNVCHHRDRDSSHHFDNFSYNHQTCSERHLHVVYIAREIARSWGSLPCGKACHLHVRCTNDLSGLISSTHRLCTGDHLHGLCTCLLFVQCYCNPWQYRISRRQYYCPDAKVVGGRARRQQTHLTSFVDLCRSGHGTWWTVDFDQVDVHVPPRLSYRCTEDGDGCYYGWYYHPRLSL